MRPEHEAAVRLALRQQDVAFKDKVAIGLFRHHEKLLVSREMNFAVHDLDLAPLIRILPTSHRFTVKQGHPFFRKGRNRDSKGEGGVEEVCFHGEVVNE